ncbi:MAG: hypothetical protein AAGG72_06225, partial [Pseudomonadota bacterium]
AVMSAQQPVALSEAVNAFKAAALQDGYDRAVAQFKCATGPVGQPPVSDADMTDSADRLVGFANDVNVDSLTAPYAPVGPAQTTLDALEKELNGRLTVKRVRRDWDEQFWPHAKAGFFKLKQKIPTVLADLGIVR